MKNKVALLVTLVFFSLIPKAFASQSLVINGVTYTFPDVDDQNWGQNVTDWATAVSTGMLQKTGGSFPLTSDVVFGSSYGVSAIYFKSYLPAATSGFLRMSSSDTITWRSWDNSQNLTLSVSSVTNMLQFNNVTISTVPLNSSALDTTASTQTKAGGLIISGSLSANIVSASSITNNGSSLLDISVSTQIKVGSLVLGGSLQASSVTVNGAQVLDVSASTQTKIGGLTLGGNVTCPKIIADGSLLTNLGGFVVLTGTQTYTGQNTYNSSSIFNATVTLNSLALIPSLKSSNFTIATEVVILASATSNLTISLPPVAILTGKTIFVKNITTNTVTLNPSGSELIDSSSTFKLSYRGNSVNLISNGVGWYSLTRASPPIRGTLWHDQAIVLAGNAISLVVDSAQSYNGYAFQSTPANGDSFSQNVFLAAGTYTFSALAKTTSASGLLDWSLDGTLFISQQDWYTGGTVQNVIKSGTVVVPFDGLHRLVGTLNGKNGSSSGYNFNCTKYWFAPTLD